MKATSFELYVSPQGNDSWSGRLPEVNATGTDGPLASLERAMALLRERRNCVFMNPVPARVACDGNGAATIWMRGGRYELSQPLVLSSEDAAPVSIRAWKDEKPCLDGGTEIKGWQVLDGDASVWMVELPEVKAGTWTFEQLWVNDRRALRPRLPRTGLFRMEDGLHGGKKWGSLGSDRFIAAPGEFAAYENLTDVEVVVLHYWIEERMPVESYDPVSRLVVSSRCSFAPLSWSFDAQQHAPYYIDNVKEAFDSPGQWYLDRPSGRLYYRPLPGESVETARFFAPRLNQLLLLKGDAEGNRPIEWLRFEGITFQHTACPNPETLEVPSGGPPHEKHVPTAKPRAAAPQAAYHIPGVIFGEGVRHCAFVDCTMQHLGWYALELGNGCRHIEISGNHIVDTGAGGIKIGGGKYGDPAWTLTGDFCVTDNHVHDGGQVFHAGTGIQIRHAGNVLVAHNHIHDYYYSAVSVGWTWGYKPTVSHNNIIEFNRIHDIGKGLLSDMGGIYLLGVAPGTVVRNNVISKVDSAHYGGWAIYPDEGSAHVVIENNICYETNCSPFHQHYGRENLVRNNIFAFGNEAVFALSRVEACRSLTVVGNIFLSRGKPIFISGYANKFHERPDAMWSDLNLFWDCESEEPTLVCEKAHTTAVIDSAAGNGLADWQALGFDRHSCVADPGFADPAAGDFSLAADSPALALGFQAIDVSRVGIRPRGER